MLQHNGRLGETKHMGLNLYLALSKLELLLEFGHSASFMPDCVITAGVGSFAKANVTDFRKHAGQGLCSEHFTAKAVGEMVVKLAVDEGVITVCERHGLVVNLQSELSPALAALLMSFNLCLGNVLISNAVGSAAGLQGRNRVSNSGGLQLLLSGTNAS